MPAAEFSLDHSAEFSRLSRLVLSPFESLEGLKTESLNLESLAWQVMGKWHQTAPDFVDLGLARSNLVEPAIKEIAQAYGLGEIEDTLKAAIYLGHRARFLNHEHAIWEGCGWYSIECSYNEDGSEIAPEYFGVAYRGATAPVGDIVSFSSIDLTRFTPDPLFSIHEFWEVLKSDFECPTGIVSYGAAYREAWKALALHISAQKRNLEPNIGIQLLRKLMRDLGKRPEDMVLWISLLAHAVLLAAM